ncbi:Sec-independent protein translocase protein TatB [Aeromonas jandaei]|uniref:Sec-independent protein translocase protein TatB n=1 Tax=Aeromonas jandaei TaxID=650 RepID=UPI001ABFCD29|nr:Sec-independent protein translocase protein TatB [Aeromonas jandaei]QSR71970.1 twin-arginine translocase subunit TatB [Aeromonas jandaei]
MFDIGFSELILIAIVALMILGPERLPAVARTLGGLTARLQRAIANIKADIQQEHHVFSDVETMRRDLQDTAQSLQQRLENEVHSVQHREAVMEQAAPKSPCKDTSSKGALR